MIVGLVKIHTSHYVAFQTYSLSDTVLTVRESQSLHKSVFRGYYCVWLKTRGNCGNCIMGIICGGRQWELSDVILTHLY